MQNPSAAAGGFVFLHKNFSYAILLITLNLESMRKENVKIFLVVILLLAVGGVYLWSQRESKSISEGASWDNPGEVFSVEAPASFNDYQKARLEEKITEAKTLYETKKGETWTWIVIANMYKFAEDYGRAISAYEQVLAIQPVEVISLGNLAHIYEKYPPDYEKAEYYYKRLLDTNPAVPSYHIDYAKFYDNKLGDQSKAEAVYLNGLQQTGNNPDMLVAVIRFYQSKNNTEKISEYSKLLLELNPDNEVYRQEFGEFTK